MASARQIAANRRNALRSTGPRTSEGKARSRRNALKHGLTAVRLVLDGDAGDFLPRANSSGDLVRVESDGDRFVDRFRSSFLLVGSAERHAIQSFSAERPDGSVDALVRKLLLIARYEVSLIGGHFGGIRNRRCTGS